MIDYKKVSLSNQISEKIEEEILHGQYPQGSIIYPEKAASDLRVGPGTVKEALIRLELVEETDAGFKVLGITAGDIADMFDVKRKIEAKATALAAEKMSDEALAELGEILKRQEKAVEAGGAEAVKNLDTKFHDFIYSCCGSTNHTITYTS